MLSVGLCCSVLSLSLTPRTHLQPLCLSSFLWSPLACLTANRSCPPESGSSVLLCVRRVSDVPVFLSIQFCVETVGTGQGSEPDRQQLQSPQEFSSPARVGPALGKGDHCRLLQMSKLVESAWAAYACSGKTESWTLFCGHQWGAWVHKKGSGHCPCFPKDSRYVAALQTESVQLALILLVWQPLLF